MFESSYGIEVMARAHGYELERRVDNEMKGKKLISIKFINKIKKLFRYKDMVKGKEKI